MLNNDIFQPNQDHSRVVLQGTGDASLMFPLGDKSHERKGRYGDNTDEVIAGNRPVLGGKGVGDKWFIDQLQVMVDRGYTPEHLEAHVRFPEISYALGHEPVPHYLVFERERLRRDVAKFAKQLPADQARKLGNFRVAGENFMVNQRFRDHDIAHQVDSSVATVLLPGDFHAMNEALHIIDMKMRGDPSALRHPLIIENELDSSGTGFWDQLLRGLKILNFKQDNSTGGQRQREYVKLDALGHHLGIYVSENRKNT